MSRHFFIGLGGSGFALLRALRCLISQELDCQPDDRGGYHYSSPGSDTPHDVRLRWLEVDDYASDELGGVFEDCYPPTGSSLRLGEHYQFSLKTSGCAYCENRYSVADLLHARIPAYDAKLASIISEIDDGQELHVHICAGINGNTGSGTVVDTVCRIRQMFPHAPGAPSRVRIHLYLVLLKRHANTSSDWGEANAYQALVELNSLNTRQWTPLDENRYLTRPPYRFETDGEPQYSVFSTCYLLERDFDYLDRELRTAVFRPLKMPCAQMFAHFLFERLFIWPQLDPGSSEEYFEWFFGEQFRELQVEFQVGSTLPRLLPGDPSWVNSPLSPLPTCYSHRFIALSIKRLFVPRKEMELHAAAVMLNEAMLHLRFNEATPGGYLDPEGALNTPEMKERYEALQEARAEQLCHAVIRKEPALWWLQENRLLNGLRLLANGEEFNIRAFWQEELENALARTEKQPSPREKNPEQYLRALLSHSKCFYEDTYPSAILLQPSGEPCGCGGGVRKYYELQESCLQETARAHAAHWEQDILLPRLRSGEMSLQEMQLTVRALGHFIRKERERLQLTEQELQARRSLKPENMLDETLRKWSRLGIISRMQQEEALLTEFAHELCEYWITQTEQQACRYAVRYLDALAQEQEKLAEQTEKLLLAFDGALRGVFNKDSHEPEGIQSLINTLCPQNHDIRAALEKDCCVKLYDPETIRQHDERLRTDAALVNLHQTTLHGGMLQTMQNRSLTDITNDFSHPNFRRKWLEAAIRLLRSKPQFAFLQPGNINRMMRELFPWQEEELDLMSYFLEIPVESLCWRPHPDIPGNITLGILIPRDACYMEPLVKEYLTAPIDRSSRAEDEISSLCISNPLPFYAFPRLRELGSDYDDWYYRGGRELPSIELAGEGYTTGIPHKDIYYPPNAKPIF